MICIIPARGGSKRLIGKNLRKLDGEYIINRVIKIANESKLFEEIIVSTDSMQIASIVIGAKVSMRPDLISGDIAEDKVLKWTAEQYWGLNFCRIYPFAALLTPERLRNGFKEFISDKHDAVMECQKYTHSTDRGFTLDLGYYFPMAVSIPSENLPTYYHDAATFMFTHVEVLDKPLEKRKIKWIPVKEWEAQDIDNQDNWDMLEIKWGDK